MRRPQNKLKPLISHCRGTKNNENMEKEIFKVRVVLPFDYEIKAETREEAETQAENLARGDLSELTGKPAMGLSLAVIPAEKDAKTPEGRAEAIITEAEQRYLSMQEQETIMRYLEPGELAELNAIWRDLHGENYYGPLVRERLEYLRGEIKAERISTGEVAELQSLAKFIEPGDVELLEWAGVPEDGQNTCDKCKTVAESTALVWITAEDFEPKEGETVKPEAFKKYDALCESCYQEELITA